MAPGGSGKTSLVADWARQASSPVAWYALDAADRDPRYLVGGLCAAVEHALPGTTHAARTALASGAPDAAAINVLLGALDEQPLALVLDDFQHLDGASETLALWDHLLRARLPSLALVILSRSIPRLGFAGLGALDGATGLGSEDLRFDVAEAGELLVAHGFDAGTAARLAARSGGWAAGVLLLGHASVGDVRFLHARPEALMGQLGAEIIAALPPDLRVFLLESAALGPATPEDANAILDRHDSAAFYAEVLARGLFLDCADTLYRYHDLFAEYLIDVLKAENPARLRAIRRAAATRWTSGGDLPRALGMLAADDDWETLAATLDRERDALWARGLWGTVLMHIERLPVRYRTPPLLILCGRARAQRDEHKAALALITAATAAAIDDRQRLDTEVLRTQILMLSGRYEESLGGAESAMVAAGRAGYTTAMTRLQEIRGVAKLRMGRFEEGLAALQGSLAQYEGVGDTNGEARTLTNLATQLVDAGYTRDAERYLARAYAIRQGAGNRPSLANLHNIRALLHALTGAYVSARAEVERALVLTRDIGYPILECAATATLAEICADEGNAVEAERYALVAREMATRLDLPDALNDALRARIVAALIRRDRAEARRLINEARPRVVRPVDAALLDLYEGMLTLCSCEHERAAEALGQATTRLEELNRPHQAARAHLLRAEAMLATGADQQASEALDRAAELVLPLGCEGYLRPAARMARRVLAERHRLRQVRPETSALLERLASAVELPHDAV